MEILLILFLAITIDLALGDPPNGIHPVAWMGKVISFLTRGSISLPPVAQFLYGLIIVLITIGLFVTPAYFILLYLKSLSFAAYVIVGAMLLTVTFSVKGLRRAALRVKRLLLEDKLDEARFELRSLVSRDTANLDKSQLVSATVESVAENSCDSFVAPLFYFLLFGVPGAIAYRIINTLDAMIGYHGKWEYLGKFAARLDDIANFIPARITALIIVLAAGIRKENISGAWHIMLRDHKKTQSPNAGWTISAIAGALGVQLEKASHYKLGDNHYPLSLKTIDASRQMMITVVFIWSLVSISAEVIYLVTT